MLPKELPKAHSAFLDYIALGPTRSLLKLNNEYKNRLRAGGVPPTTNLPTLKGWSIKYDWQQRLKAHSDALATELETVRKEAVTHFINRALKSGDALMDKLDDQIERYEMQRVRRSRTVDDPRDSERPEGERRQIRVIEMEVTTLDLQRLTSSFSRTMERMLKILGDDDTITISGPADKIKGYIGISPDDWDDVNTEEAEADE